MDMLVSVWDECSDLLSYQLLFTNLDQLAEAMACVIYDDLKLAVLFFLLHLHSVRREILELIRDILYVKEALL